MEWTKGKVKGFHGKDLLSGNTSIKLVKLNPHAKYPEHIHPDKTEFAFVLEGNIEVLIDTEKYIGEKDDFFIFPSGITHSIMNPTDIECIVLIGAILN